MSRYAQLLAREAGMSQGEVAQAGLGGFLHDLGKIGIPDSVLKKPGPLTDEALIEEIVREAAERVPLWSYNG